MFYNTYGNYVDNIIEDFTPTPASSVNTQSQTPTDNINFEINGINCNYDSRIEITKIPNKLYSIGTDNKLYEFEYFLDYNIYIQNIEKYNYINNPNINLLDVLYLKIFFNNTFYFYKKLNTNNISILPEKTIGNINNKLYEYKLSKINPPSFKVLNEKNLFHCGRNNNAIFNNNISYEQPYHDEGGWTCAKDFPGKLVDSKCRPLCQSLPTPSPTPSPSPVPLVEKFSFEYNNKNFYFKLKNKNFIKENPNDLYCFNIDRNKLFLFKKEEYTNFNYNTKTHPIKNYTGVDSRINPDPKKLPYTILHVKHIYKNTYNTYRYTSVQPTIDVKTISFINMFNDTFYEYIYDYDTDLSINTPTPTSK